VSIAVALTNEHDIAVAPEVLKGGPKRGHPRDASRTVLELAHGIKRRDLLQPALGR
jgi:hypothetical protein